tara:strand:- start:727 stop:930 length:204 start_codon:yes stop_codon:yes gene_type:complete
MKYYLELHYDRQLLSSFGPFDSLESAKKEGQRICVLGDGYKIVKRDKLGDVKGRYVIFPRTTVRKTP